MVKTGLVLEGGGTRGVFTSGVLDYFMEQDLYLPYVIGVSAGSCNAVDYVSKQPERTRKCMIDYLRTGSYAGLKYLIRKKSLFDMDLIFDVFPNSVFPFDYETYFKSRQKCYIVATNCLTGKAAYIAEGRNKSRLMTACRASSSIPVIAPVVYVDGVPMLDGGIADSVPIKKALKDGCKKAVVILTRCKGYRKSPNNKLNRMVKAMYKQYPEFIKAVHKRPAMYNKTMEFIEKLEDEGKIFVIRPEVPVVKQAEKNPDVLYAFYKHGYEHAKEIYPKLIEYLNEE